MTGDAPPSEVESFLRWMRVERGRAGNTVDSYRRDLARASAWLAVNGTTLCAASPVDLQGFVAHLQSTGDSAASTARRIAALRMFFRFHVSEGTVAADPTADLEGVRVAAGVPKPLDLAETEAVLASVTGGSPADARDRALLEFMVATGARVSEVCGLDLQDIDREAQLVRLLGKGSKERVVPLGRTALRVLLDYVDGGPRSGLAGAHQQRREDRSAVFLTNRGRRLSRQKAWDIVRSAGVRAGLPRELSPHVLRHTCATLMLDGGADLRIVQEMLGHASISTTQVYTKVSQERLMQVYRASHPRAGM